MDGRELENLTDEALDREIAAALDVQPSPEFLARVRTRVAAERIEEGWRWLPAGWRPVGLTAGWLWAGASLAVVALAIAGLWSARLSPAPVSQQAAVTPVVEAPLPVPEIVTPAIELTQPAASLLPTPHVHDVPLRPQVVEKAPEVVFSKDESMALQQLFAALGARRLELTTLPDLESSLKAPSKIEEIVLEPLALSPLAGPDAE